MAELLAIFGQMKLSGHVDPDLFDVVLRKRIWLDSARKFLAAEQVDKVELSRVPGSPVA